MANPHISTFISRRTTFSYCVGDKYPEDYLVFGTIWIISSYLLSQKYSSKYIFLFPLIMSQQDGATMLAALNNMQAELNIERKALADLATSTVQAEITERDRLAAIIPIHEQQLLAKNVEYNALRQLIADRNAERERMAKDVAENKVQVLADAMLELQRTNTMLVERLQAMDMGGRRPFIGGATVDTDHARNARNLFSVKLPSYSGTEDFDAWLKDWETKCLAMQLGDADKMLWTMAQLKGNALQHAEQCRDIATSGGQTFGFPEVIAALRDRFVPKNQHYYLRRGWGGGSVVAVA